MCSNKPILLLFLLLNAGQLFVCVEDKAEEGCLFRARDGEWMLLAGSVDVITRFPLPLRNEKCDLRPIPIRAPHNSSTHEP